MGAISQAAPQTAGVEQLDGMRASPLVVVLVSPEEIEPRRVVAELRSAIEEGRRRPPLQIRAVPNG